MTTTAFPDRDLAPLRTSLRRRVGPAYVRGLPAWMWRAAMRAPSQRAAASA